MRDETRGMLMLLLVAMLVLFVALWLSGGITLRATPTLEESTWPDSAEFSQIESGADRFSEHATNLEGVIVLVDHETGIQYAMTAGGVTPLLEADGTPMTVLEVGE